MTPSSQITTVHMGRSSIDLYSNDTGAPFSEITSFAAYVGGSPTNISVGVRRLGMQSAIVTGLGDDPVADFIRDFLVKEQVVVDYCYTKPGRRTSAVLLGIEPPNRFPLVYYRDNCADMALTIDDVLRVPLAEAKLFQFAGSNLYGEPTRSATLFAAEQARRAGVEVVLDVDFRPTLWHDPRAFGVAIRAALPNVDIVIGTEDELNAAVLADASQMSLTHSQVSDTRVTGDVGAAIRAVMAYGVKAVIEKVGAQGCRIHLPSGEIIDAEGYPVEVYNILGAGDAFGAGFIYGHLSGWGWRKACRLGNACGAIVVTKHGCANFMPTLEEVTAFASPRGGFD